MVASAKLSANLKVVAYDFDPDESAVTDIGFVDMSDYETFMAIFVRTVGTGALESFNIIANYVTDTGTDVTVKAHAIASEPDALMDKVILECTASEVHSAVVSGISTLALQQTAKYVSAECELATSTDEGVVIYILGGAKRPAAGLTADSIA
jgi:hypothetical protein